MIHIKFTRSQFSPIEAFGIICGMYQIIYIFHLSGERRTENVVTENEVTEHIIFYINMSMVLIAAVSVVSVASV